MASYYPGAERVGKVFTEENSAQSYMGGVDQAPFEGDEGAGTGSFPRRSSTGIWGEPMTEGLLLLAI